jgi:excisionase family DNA binding protein
VTTSPLPGGVLAYRYEEVARALGVPLSTVKWYVSVGYLRTVGSGNGSRIVAESVRHWMHWCQDPPPSFRPVGTIYLVRFRHYYKIGLSKNIDGRFRSLGTMLPEPPELIHTMPTNDMRRGEADLHERFARRRVNGEWFKLTPNEVAHICKFKALVF